MRRAFGQTAGRKQPIDPELGHEGDLAGKAGRQNVMMVGVVGVHHRLGDDKIAPIHQSIGPLRGEPARPDRIAGIFQLQIEVAKSQRRQRNFGLAICIEQNIRADLPSRPSARNRTPPPRTNSRADEMQRQAADRKGWQFRANRRDGPRQTGVLTLRCGCWVLTLKPQKIGQGRENAKMYLKDNPGILAEIEEKVKVVLGIGGDQNVAGGEQEESE